MLPFKIALRGSRRIAQNSRKRPIVLVDPAENQPLQRPSRRMALKKQDAEKYEIVREMDRIRSRIYRLGMTDNEREHSNRLAAIRQRRYRQRIKDQERKKRRGKEAEHDRKTRGTTEKDEARRKKQREKKRKQRAKLSKSQKEKINAERRRKYAEDEGKIREEAAKMADKSPAPQEVVSPSKGPEPPTPPSSKSARRKRMGRLLSMLPTKVTHIVELCEDMLCDVSPSKMATLKQATPKKRKIERKLETEMCKIVQTQVKQSKYLKSSKLALHALKKYRLQRHASRVLKINRKAIQTESKKSAGRPRLPITTVRAVTKFYEKMAQPLPERKLVSKKTGKPAMILAKPILELYAEFTEAHPSMTISKCSFFRLKPRHVRSSRLARYRGCLCEYCENVSLKLQALNRSLHENSLGSLALKDGKQAVGITLCEKNACDKFHSLTCINRECDACGVHKLLVHLSPLMDQQPAKPTAWRRWSLVKNGKTTKRALTVQEGTIKTLIEELCAELQVHAKHQFQWWWQASQYQRIGENLPQKWVLAVLDFAENYTCFYQDEAQGAYWTHNLATVHPVVTSYKCESCPETVTESIVFISPDNKHDHDAVHAYMDLVSIHLQQKRALEIDTMVRFSDGCASQYKSRGPFADIAMSRQDYGFSTVHNYFGTRHGKGPSDGESAVVKSKAATAVKSGTTVISDARSLYDYCSDALTKDKQDDGCTHFRRCFYYVDNVVRGRERSSVKSLRGTRSQHSVSTGDMKSAVRVRELSCFCESCITDSTIPCENASYVSAWKEVVLQSSVVVSHDGRHDGDHSRTADDEDPKSKEAGGNEGLNGGDDSYDEEVGGSNGGDCSRCEDSQVSLSVEVVERKTEEARSSRCDDDKNGGSGTAGWSGTAGENGSLSGSDGSDGSMEGRSHEGPNLEATCSNQDGTHELDVNSYVALKFDCGGKTKKMFTYMALVTRKCGEQFQLKFMRRTTEALYDFTTEREAIHPKEDIIRVVKEPSMVLLGRSCVYRFHQEDIEKLSRQYVLK